MTTTTKVTMGLTDRDIDNTDTIQRLTHARSRAQAISTALSLARFVTEQKSMGAHLLLKLPNGEIERIVMTELDNIEIHA